MIQADIGVPGFEFVAYRKIYAAARSTGGQPGFFSDREVAEQGDRQPVG